MPQPTRSAVHVNRPLTNISVAFVQADTFFVARKVFPGLPVQKQSDVYFVYPRDQWFTDEMAERAPGTESAGSGYNVATDSYGCKVWSLHKDVADQIRNNADDPIDLDREATEWLSQKWLIRQERQWVSKFFGASTWTGSISGADITPTTKWDAASGNPVNDIEIQIKSMWQKTGGFKPNKMVVTPDVDTALKNNADVKDRIKYTQRVDSKTFTPKMMADLFGVDEYLICGGVYNTAKENAAKNMQFIAGTQKAGLFYAPSSPGLYTPSAGYTFDWTGHVGAGKNGQAISNFRMEPLKADRVEIEAAFDMKVVASDLGVFFTSVLT